MYKLAKFSVGLFDKDTLTQKISMDEAYSLIDEIIMAAGYEDYTTIECRGHWTMKNEASGEKRRVSEPTIRIEIADAHAVSVIKISHELATRFNQQCVMVEYIDSNIGFEG